MLKPRFDSSFLFTSFMYTCLFTQVHSIMTFQLFIYSILPLFGWLQEYKFSKTFHLSGGFNLNFFLVPAVISLDPGWSPHQPMWDPSRDDATPLYRLPGPNQRAAWT